MEQVHGVDVSWMSQGSFKEKFHKPFSAPDQSDNLSQPRQLPAEPQVAVNSPTVRAESKIESNDLTEPIPITDLNASARHSRSGSIDKTSPGPNGTPPSHRRSSWFSNISAKFSSSPTLQQQQPPNQPCPNSSQSPPGHPSRPLTQSPPPALSDLVVPRISANRNAVLQHASKPEGDGPYTPAPPKSGQAGFLGVFRRLSSAGTSSTPTGKLSHGLVERKVLNVDRTRERCPIAELKDSKMRRVSFCVDVEIAPLPKYGDGGAQTRKPMDKFQKKMTERAEGEALKNPKIAEAHREAEKARLDNSLGESSKARDASMCEVAQDATDGARLVADAEAGGSAAAPKETTRKKEKKKKSEEERKVRKEKRRKLAEANGSIPVEIQYDSSDSSDSPDGSGNVKTTCFPTTNPVRIYRRCCQLRESPILKKITEQLNDPANTSSTTGFVDKLDLAGYYMQFADLMTLGDYLAVVPVREVILDHSGLTDEGLRVVLAGLLAAKRPEMGRRRSRLDVERRGGVVERLSLKENSLGMDGWKHIALFIYMSKSLKQLDVSKVPFPRQPLASKNGSATLPNGTHVPLGIADILARALAERPAGSMLEMVNMGETEPSIEQLGTIMEGLIRCRVRRVGVANNHLDKEGLGHVARYLQAGHCEGLDLGGNDLRDDMAVIASSINEKGPLWAISLAGCNLAPSSLCRILPVLTRLQSLRFINLSHNRDLFDMKPHAVGVLRRYLPKLEQLKRLHLQDVNMTAEQAIAIVEVVPEVHSLCHLNVLDNAEIMHLANGKTEEAKEEACALYASLMAATRISKSMICVDIEVPGPEASEVVKAMAKQVVAYCLRNMEQVDAGEVGATVAAAAAEAHAELSDGSKPSSYPDVIAHLVGQDAMEEDVAMAEDDEEATADENYVIGGSGVVKALTFCLDNRGETGDLGREEGGSGSSSSSSRGGLVEDSQGLRLPTGGKAKDLSKHLLAGARKIRLRLQPALKKAKASPSDELNLRKLVFLDETLQGIIKRFEDEFPDTRESAKTDATVPASSGGGQDKDEEQQQQISPTTTTEMAAAAAAAAAAATALSEDETEIHTAKPLSRSNSRLSKVLAEEEGRVHRAGHKFRQGVLDTNDTAKAIEDIGTDPNHIRFLTEMAEDVGGELLERVREKGLIRAFKEHRDLAIKGFQGSDAELWPRFVEAQQKAQANKEAEGRRYADESAVQD